MIYTMLKFLSSRSLSLSNLGRVFTCGALVLAALSAQATDYVFPGTLPPGCNGSNGDYSCGTLTLPAGDTITIAAPIPVRITFSGAFTVGERVQINSAGSADRLSLVTNGVLTLGASATANANVTGTAAINIGIGSTINGSVAAQTPQGVVTFGANSKVSGSLSSNEGAITLGDGASVGSNLSSLAGVLTLNANTRVGGNVTSSDGAINIGDGSIVCGNVAASGGGVVTLTTNVKVGGYIGSNAGAVTVGDGSTVNSNVTASGAGVITLTGVLVGGNVAATGGAITLTRTQVRGSVSPASAATMTSSSANVESLYIAPACASASASVVAANFECLETNVNTPWVASARRPLYTKLAGTPFTFDVTALKADGSLETNYVATGEKSKPVLIELVDGSGSTVCSARNAIDSTGSQTLTFAAADRGRKLIASITLAKSYTDLRCRVTDANQSAKVVSCSSDDFSVRPGAVALVSTPTMASPPSAKGLPHTKAGAGFTLRAATATAASDAYTGLLALDSSKLTAQTPNQDASQAPGGAVGLLSPTTLTANAIPSNNASYDEVGYVYLAAGAYRDASFTAVDQQVGDCVANSTSVVAVGGKFGCIVGNDVSVALGRFYPDHFSVAANTVTAACTSSTPFTYFGQDGFTTTFTLTANNLAGGTTKNYTGVFAKFDLTNYANYGFGSSNLPAGTSLGSGGQVPSGQWVDGVASVTARHQVSRPANPIVEAGVVVSAAPSDGEVSAGAATALGNATQMRYGRLRMQNVYGSELLALPIPFEAQYWTGNFYATNLADSCTVVNASAIAMGNYQKQLSACKTQFSPVGNVVLVAGKLPAPGWVLSKPGANNGGSVDLALNLGAVATGKNCVSPTESAASAINMPWFGPKPTALATFGIYKSSIIYRRENY
ncbi:MAG: hypothetical protein H7172_02330 [Ferruginibacter sp.]|nr:hypothetical protein [Rhodoferax sp.]